MPNNVQSDESPMHRRIIAYLTVLGLLLPAVSVHAQAKPQVAVLGLEVIDSGQGIDVATSDLANRLTNALRRRVEVDRRSPYRMAPNSAKDLLELKLLSGCAEEGRSCMADIGRELNAAFLIYGKLERRGVGFQVTLNLLNVEAKTMERSTSEVIPLADNNPPAINNKWSRTLYYRLTGIPEQGTLAVSANAMQGNVFIDGDMATTLTNGRAEISDLNEGVHRVAIHADGYVRREIDVTIRAGRTEEVSFELEAIPIIQPPISDSDPGTEGMIRPGGAARVLFWTSLGFAVAGAVGIPTFGTRVRDEEKNLKDLLSDMNRDFGSIMTSAPNVCDEAGGYSGPTNDDIRELRDICDSAELNQLLTNISIGVASVGVVAAGYFLYAGYIRPASMAPERAQAGMGSGDGKRARSRLEFAPRFTPNYVGARLKIDF